MEIKNKVYNNTLYIMLSGELDENTANYTRKVMDDIMNASIYRKMVIDLSSLEFMDSTGVGVLIGRYKKLKSRNIPIYIYNPSEHIERIFKMSGLYEIMPKIS